MKLKQSDAKNHRFASATYKHRFFTYKHRFLDGVYRYLKQSDAKNQKLVVVS
jgi:exonuclease III